MKKVDSERMAYLTNPRPDLAEDAELWARLLLKAYPVDNDAPDGLYWTLHGFRCNGAHLRLGRGTLVLEAGEMSEEEYMRLRTQWLLPHAAQLRQMLADLAVPAMGEGKVA